MGCTRYLVVALLLSAPWLEAAEQTGTVTSRNLPIPGATVLASRDGAKVVTYTNENGGYRFPDLAPGEWTIEISAFGFAPSTRTINVGAGGEPVAWNLTLEPESPPAATPATAPQPPNQQQQPERFQRVLTNRTAQQEMLARVEAAPLATESSSFQSLRQDANESFLVSGSLSRGLGMAEMGVAPGMGSPGGPGGMMQESTVPGFDQGNANQPSGEPGMEGPGTRGPGGPGGGPPMRGGGFRGPGGRGGAGGRGMRGGRPDWMGRRGVGAFGNRRPPGAGAIRGQAFFALSNSAFDASPYSLTGQTVDKPSYARSRFGIGLGGQLRIPKLIDSPNTFFFLNYSGTRSRSQYSRFGIVPTEAERQGDFSASTVRGAPAVVYDPSTSQPFAGNQIPSARLSTASTALAGYYPLPNMPGSIQNYYFATSYPNSNDNFSARLNHSLNSKNRLNGSFSLQRRASDAYQLLGFRDDTSGRGQRTDLGWTYVFTSTLINNLRLDFSRNRADTLPYFAYGTDVAGELGIQGTSRDPANYGPPDLSFTNFSSLADANLSRRTDQSTGIDNGVTWVRGKHNLSFGFSYRRTLANQLSDTNGRGSYSFSGLVTSAFDDQGNPLSGTGYDFADFLLGFPQSSTIRYGTPSTYFRGAMYGAYAQDDWRVGSNLSVNVGLRYDYAQPTYEKYDREANLDIAPGFTAVSVVTADGTGPYTGAYPRALIDPDKNNVAPRIGIAWRPFGKATTQIRSGYGIYYNGSIYNQLASRLAQQPPFAYSNTLNTSIDSPLTILDGFLSSPSLAEITNTYAVDRGYRTGYAQTWNLSVQQNLPWALVLEVGYLGTKGTRLDIQRLPNQAAPGSPADSEDRRLIGNAVGFTFESAEGNSIYHAGQFRLMRRFRRGIAFNALYTWSKSIDNVSTYGGGRTVVVQNDKDLAAERGLSSFDQRQTLSLNFNLTSPVGLRGTRPAEGLAGTLLKDWTLNGGITVQSGTPFTALVLGNRSDAGGTGVVGSARADATGLPVTAGSGFFNTLAFAVPAAGAFGDAARNTIPGPGSFALNASLGRSFSLGRAPAAGVPRRGTESPEHRQLHGHRDDSQLGRLRSGHRHGRDAQHQPSGEAPVLTMKPRWIPGLLLLTGLVALPQETARFSVTTNLVVVNVEVRDHDGQPIEGLTRNDFELLEDGKPQRISVFEYQRLESEVPTPAPAATTETANEPTEREGVIAQSKPGEIRYRDRRLIVLYFDLSAMGVAEQIRAREGAEEFIRTSMTPSDSVAVIAFSSELKVLQDFTDDRDALLATIARLRIGESSDLADSATVDETNVDTGAVFTADSSEFDIFNTDRKLSALESAVNMLASLPEKKALVYFSGGVSRTGAENESQLRATVNAAMKANVSFYPVDARGLVAEAPGGDVSVGTTRGSGMFSGQAQRGRREQFLGQQETLYTLAADTGGKALLDSNQLSAGIVQAQRDIASYYILGYYSTNPAEDGKYRKVEVRIPAQRSARLDYRTGYFAPKSWERFNSMDKERQLEAAMLLEDPITDLPVALEVDYFRRGPDRYIVPVAVKIPGSEIQLAKRRGREEARLDFIAEVRDKQGRQAGMVRDFIPIRLEDENVGQLKDRLIYYDTAFTLPPGGYRLKFVVRENETGKIGTFETPFTIPDLAADNTTLRLSSVIWGNQREPVRAAIGRVGMGGRLLRAHPFVQGDEKIVPSITKVFHRGRELYVFLEAYEPGTAGKNGSVDLAASVSLFSDAGKVLESDPVRVTANRDPRSPSLPIEFSVPLEKLDPGRYVCQLSVIDRAGQKFAFARTPMVVLPALDTSVSSGAPSPTP